MSFHWLSHHVIRPLTPCSTNAKSVRLIFIFYFSYFRFYILEPFFNKTIIRLVLIGYEMIIENPAPRASLATYHSFPMRAGGIIVKKIISLANVRAHKKHKIVHVNINKPGLNQTVV